MPQNSYTLYVSHYKSSCTMIIAHFIQKIKSFFKINSVKTINDNFLLIILLLYIILCKKESLKFVNYLLLNYPILLILTVSIFFVSTLIQ